MARKRRTVLEVSETTEQPLLPGGDNWESCVQVFMEDLTLRNLSWHTKRHHQENINGVQRLITFIGFSTDHKKISTDMFKKLIVHMLEKEKLSSTTVNHRIRTSKQFFAFLVQEGYLPDDPLKNIKKVKAPKTIIEAFTRDQMRSLLDQPDKKTFVGFRDYCIMLVLLDTGLRLSELLNIRLDDINLNQRKIKVMGKGAKERNVYFETTTRDALKRYIAIRGDNLHHSFLWISHQDEPYNRNSLQDRLPRYGKQAGLKNVRVSPHTFRHTFAKLFILNGGNTLALQKLLGHSTLEMVRHYVNLWGTDLQAMHRQYSPVDNLMGKNIN